MTDREKISKEIKQLVLVRLETLPSDKKISIGYYGDFEKADLINHVEKEDEVGKKIIEIEIEFLRNFKKGLIR
ncbi:MAG: hypothetical protein Q8R00_04905 [Candidatus Nanoarchaeia archaeon]|nr:hypothetical protein [Candidatus Nanoarchaeia archaeon]